MVLTDRDLKKASVSCPKNGLGKMDKTILLTEAEMFGKGKTFAKLILHPGCAMGFHMHDGDSEFYYILSGTGEYNDNGTIKCVNEGDLCAVSSGAGHSLKNTGDSDLTALALILFS